MLLLTVLEYFHWSFVDFVSRFIFRRTLVTFIRCLLVFPMTRSKMRTGC